jgi:hypothetical protein
MQLTGNSIPETSHELIATTNIAAELSYTSTPVPDENRAFDCEVDDVASFHLKKPQK